MHEDHSPLGLFQDAFQARNRRRPPVWLMRQAGRYMPEYRALREKHSFIEMCTDAKLATEVSLLPHELLDIDGLIVFYDILIPLQAMGAELAYGESGPVFSEPVTRPEQIESLRDIAPESDTPAILEAIRRLKDAMADRKPVFGFAGAPFTLAAYLVEGRVGAKGAETVMRVAYQEPEFLHALLDRLATMTARYLTAQLDAGADAVQLFDTWAGRLGASDYRDFALPYQQRIFQEISRHSDRPTILYVRDSSHLLEELGESRADVLSLDWRVSLRAAREHFGARRVLQGNLDPAALFASPERVRAAVLAKLEELRGDPAFVFNLGHGIQPGTPVESVRALVETVRSFEP